MKKGFFIVTGILTALLLTVGGLFLRDSRNTKKSDEELFIAAAKTVAYEFEQYAATGDEDFFNMAAEDISRMGDMSVPDILSDEEKSGIFEKTVEAFSQNRLKLTGEAERFSEAFVLLGNDPLDSYPYTQLKIALNNCGITD